MTPLPSQWTRRGIVSRVIRRTGDIVMVQLGKADCYEVAIVQRHNGYNLPGGRVAEAKEYMPSDEQFGTLGWYYCALDKAEAKFAALVVEANTPKPPKRGPNSRRPIPTPTPELQNA